MTQVQQIDSSTERATVTTKLSTLDRFLPVWIIAAMIAGLLLGRIVSGIGSAISAVEVEGVSLPIALGLLVMMYPVLAKVRYDRLDTVAGDRRLLGSSLLLNWVVGPALMFTLAWIFLPDLPEYRTGLIIVGLARCIAMVIIWNDLACGDREAAAVLVAINSVFQVIAFAALGCFYLSVLPGWLGLDQANLDISAWHIAGSVLVFLGVPLLAGYLSRRIGEKRWGRAAYERSFLPKIGPVGAVRAAVHNRDPVRSARRQHHLQAARRGPDRAAAAGVLRIDVGRRLPAGPGPRNELRTHHHSRLHRRREQLRTSHRRRDRNLWCHVRPGSRWSRRTTHRGAGARRSRLCGPCSALPVHPHPCYRPGGLSWLTAIPCCSSA